MRTRILILVLSYNESPYRELMLAQQQTWESENEPDVATIFYYGGNKHTDWHLKPLKGFPDKLSYELCLSASDDYYYMAGKFKMVLDFVKDWGYDYIFRTNSSSYVHKRRLKNFSLSLPKANLYGGWTFVDSNDDGGLCVSGAGMWLSKDVAEILRNEIDVNVEMEEDVYCSRILRSKGIMAVTDKSRFDVGNYVIAPPLDRYHYRLKSADRLNDAKNFFKLHEKVK